MIWTLDIETIPQDKIHEEIVKKRVAGLIDGMKWGTKDEKESLRKGLFEGIRAEVLIEYQKKLSLAEKGSALDPRFGKLVCFNIYNGEEHQGIIDESEKDLLGFVEDLFMNTNIPASGIFTYNGNKFDFPFLMFRARVNEYFTLAKYISNIYRQTVDMFYVFNDKYDKRSYITLNDCARILDIPTGIIFTNKSDMTKYIKDNPDRILNICQSDCLVLYNIAVRMGFSHNTQTKTGDSHD